MSCSSAFVPILGLGGRHRPVPLTPGRSMLCATAFAAHVNDGYGLSGDRAQRALSSTESIAEIDLPRSHELNSLRSDQRLQCAAVKQIIDGLSPIGTLAIGSSVRPTTGRQTQFRLQDIEDGILYKAGEPRVHFAMVNASYSAGSQQRRVPGR